jgi:hypothetical protein
MDKNDFFIKKMKSDIAHVRAELARFRVRCIGFTGEAKDRHDKHVASLELKIDQINGDLINRNKAGIQLWKHWDLSLQNSRRELQAELRNTIQSFETEPGLADSHGDDTGPFPYGNLRGRPRNK